MSQKNTYFILALIIVAIVFLLAGWQYGKFSVGKLYQEELSQKQEEIKVLESSLEMFYHPLPEEVYNLSGTVIEVGDKFLVMEALVRVNRLPLPGGAESEKRNIKVNVAGETKIFRINIIESIAGSPIPSIEDEILGFSDIKIGDIISVTAEENIKDKKEITASEIRVND